MPLPFILGGLAVAAVATGAKKTYDGYQDKSLADELVNDAKKQYQIAESDLQIAQAETEEALNELGKFYLKIGRDFNEFTLLAEELIDKLEKSGGKHFEIKLPTYSVAKIESLAMNSVAFAGKLASGAVGGVAAAYAVYGGVMSLAAASTGTAISSLSGVAAYNATLAAIGGGSIASGGFGMAVGAKILGGVVAAPVVAVAGFAYASYAADALEKAYDIQRQVNKYEKTVAEVKESLRETNEYIYNISMSIKPIYESFQSYLEDLKIVEMMVRRGNQNLLEGQDNILRMVENGYALAAILADIITTPLFKIKNANLLFLDSTSEPEFEKDSNGLNVLNRMEIKSALKQGQDKFQNIE